MRRALWGLIIFTVLLNTSCRRNVETSPVAANGKSSEIPAEIPQPASTPQPYGEIDLIEKFSRNGADKAPEPIEYKGYKISLVTVKKSEEGSPVADIDDAVLTKDDKRVARFEGVYYPLGNSMNFGLYNFLGDGEKQFAVVDESNRYDRLWIVNLSPKYEVVFDAADYDVLDGRPTALDIDGDDVLEISFIKFCEPVFDVPMSERPWLRVVFIYNAQKRRYVPASHVFTEYTLSQKRTETGFSFEVFMTYIYAGKESEAWRFFDERFSDKTNTGEVYMDKEKTRTKIKAALNKDRIYKYIRSDLRR